MSKTTNKNFKIFLAGHNGLVGSSILRRLKFHGFKNVITANRSNLDLRDQKLVEKFFKKLKVILLYMLELILKNVCGELMRGAELRNKIKYLLNIFKHVIKTTRIGFVGPMLNKC